MGLVSINTNIDALNAGRFFNQNIGNLSKANAQLSSGRIDSDASDAPAAAAVGANLSSAILAQTQAASNVTQASALISLAAGSLQSMSQILQTMKARATQANADTIGPAQRAMLNEEYQSLLSQVDNTAKTTWNGVTLFAGGSGANNRLGDKSLTGTGATTDNISTDFTLNGFVAGGVESVNVKSSGDASGLVNVVVGGQSFQGTIPLGATGSAQLTSVTDHANTITLNLTGTGLTDTDDIQRELKKLFQLDIGSPISMRSASRDLSGTITSATTSAATSPGIYGLSSGYNSTANTITYKVSNGLQVWEKTYDANSASDSDLGLAARTVVFDNGFTVKTTANNNETNPPAGVEIINVEAGNQVTMTFQVGDVSTNVIDIQFKPATVLSLNLTGTVISEKSTAATTADSIDKALIEVSNMIAKLGGTKAQLNFTGQSLALQIQNEQYAKATFTDADITTALQSAQEATALVNMSSTIFQNTLQQPKKLAELVQTVMR
ncbi:MAG: flagellin [Pseudomonadota bacterium]